MAQNQKEIERKFITNLSVHNGVNRLAYFNFDVTQFEGQSIFQFYLAFKPSEIRYRRIETDLGIKFLKTVKTGEGLSRQEVENEVSKEEFYLSFPDSTFFIHKQRYENKELKMSIDFYPDGLSIMEIEFDSEEEALSFDITPLEKIIEREVTGEKEFSNGTLSRERYSYLKSGKMLRSIQREMVEENLRIFVTALNPYDPSERDIYPVPIISFVRCEGLVLRHEANRTLSFYKEKKSGGKSSSMISYYGKKNEAISTLYICFSELIAKRIYSDLSKKAVSIYEEKIKKLSLQKQQRLQLMKDLHEEIN